jgi:hypothetical protein
MYVRPFPEDLLRAGWETLHATILASGANASADFAGPQPADQSELLGGHDYAVVDYIYPEIYLNYLAPMLGPLPRLGGEPFSHSSEALTSIWNLLSIRFSDTPGLLSEFSSFRTWESVLVASKEAVVTLQIPRDQTPNFLEPKSVARYARRLIWSAHSNAALWTWRLAWGLALLEWVMYALCVRRRCDVCFRTAWPGRPHCAEHSQSDVDELTRARQYQSYRRGKTVAKILNQRRREGANAAGQEWVSWRHSPAIVELRESLFAAPQRSPCFKILKGNLTQKGAKRWPFLVLGELAVYDVVRHVALVNALLAAPRVVRRLGVRSIYSCKYFDLAEEVRRSIDPHRLSIFGIEHTVAEAQAWFEIEDNLPRGIRGKGGKTIALVQKASELARAGKTKSQVADELGVSMSRLSNWVKRYKSFAACWTSPPPGSSRKLRNTCITK